MDEQPAQHDRPSEGAHCVRGTELLFTAHARSAVARIHPTPQQHAPRLTRHALRSPPLFCSPPLFSPLEQRSVPSTQLGRIWGFAGLGASLALGTVKDAVSRAWTGPAQGESGEGGAAYSAFLTEKNAERLAVWSSPFFCPLILFSGG